MWPASVAWADEEPPAQLVLVRAAEAQLCPDESSLKAEVSARLGRDPFGQGGAQRFEGIIRRSERGWSAELYRRNAAGELLGSRELESGADSCDSLGAALALAIALAIDPDAALGPSRREDTAESQPEVPIGADAERPPLASDAGTDLAENETPVVNAEPSRALPSDEHSALELASPSEALGDPLPPPEVDRPRRPVARVALGLRAAYQLVPGFAPGVMLDVDLRLSGPLRGLIGMQFFPEQESGGTDAAFGFGHTSARVGLCLGKGRGRIWGSACLALALGATHAVVYQPRPSAPGDYFFGAVSLSAEAAVDIAGPLYVGLGAALWLPLVRHEFRVEGREAIEFTLPVLVPSLSLLVGVALG